MNAYFMASKNGKQIRHMCSKVGCITGYRRFKSGMIPFLNVRFSLFVLFKLDNSRALKPTIADNAYIIANKNGRYWT